jgi:Fe-S-cluster containining protein
VSDRASRGLTPAENSNLCSGCVRCCTYISVEIDAPRSSREYDQWIWALHHEGISMFVENPEAWYLLVETRCRQLNEAGRCDIHGRHPVLCRDYDARTCERRKPAVNVRAEFRSAEQFETWLARERPGHWRRLLLWREESPGPAKAELRADRAAAATLIPIASLSLAAARPALRDPVGRAAPARRLLRPAKRAG